jgi:putative hemolysin
MKARIIVPRLLAFLLVYIVLGGGQWVDSDLASGQVDEPIGLANPAAVYCNELGYEYDLVDSESGQSGICKFPDGSTCGEWEFLAGQCGEAFSYCAQEGLGIKTLTDGNNPFSPEYAVCVSEDGEVLGSIVDLVDLNEKAKGCDREARPSPQDTDEGDVPEDEVDIAVGDISDTLPASFDWRNRPKGNYLTNVKNQGICGSCWAFSAVGVSEAALNIAGDTVGDNYNLSEQYLVSDCYAYGGYSNCCGGWKDDALEEIRDTGVPDENCMVYVDGKSSTGCSCGGGTCDSNCTFRTGGDCSDRQCSDRCANWSSRLVKIKSTGAVSSTRTAIQTALVNKGPLAVSLHMSGSFDANDVYKCAPVTGTNHAVIIVGYNNAGNYWWVRNSWGATWGRHSDGYFKVGYGECNIESKVYYAEAQSEAPVLVAPRRTITDKTPTYKWRPVTGATHYHIQVKQGTSTILSKVYSSGICTATLCNTTPTTKLAYKTYKWRARARKGGVWKPYSNWKTFTVLNPNIPILLSPRGTISDKTPTYKWKPVTGATRYQIQVKLGATTVLSKVYPAGVCTATRCSGTPSTVLGNKTYKWRARAYKSSRWKPFSVWQSFTVSTGFNSQFTSHANGWTAHKGTWTIASGRYRTTGAGPSKVASASYASKYTKQTYSARMKRSGCPTCVNMLYIRGTPTPLDSYYDWYRGYRFSYTNTGYINVVKFVNGSWSYLQIWTTRSAINKNGWNVLKVTANGSSLKFYINGTLVWSGSDSALANGKVGLGMYRSSSSPGDLLQVEWAKLSTSAPTGVEADEELTGEVFIGDDPNISP